MRLQARRCQGTETPSGRAEAWPRLCQPQSGSAARTSTSGFWSPGLKDHTFLLSDATPSVVLGCCSPRGSRRGNSFSSLGCGGGEPLTRAQPWPFPQLSHAVPQVQVCASQTQLLVRTCSRLAEASSSFW